MAMPAAPAARVTTVTDLAALEGAVGTGPLCAWDTLLQRDPYATLFQGPTWTLCWYRAYAERFDPLVIVLEDGDGLAGVAPMAVERRTGRLAFAGDNMADYRDVVAQPAHRERLIREVVRVYREARPRVSLRFGSTLPESTSPQILLDVCRDEGVPALSWSHQGWRWWPEQARAEPFKSRSARYKLNRLKRRGEVRVDPVGREEWAGCRQAFFDQHSLRQIARGTEVSFGSADKRRFFDALMDTPLAHVTVLRAGGAPVAWHYGCLDRGVLYLGAPAFDLREHRQSPGLLLILLLMQEAASRGIRGVDLTIGEGELKERCSTSEVVLPTIELLPHRRAETRRRLVRGAAATARLAFGALGQESRWKTTIRPAGLQVLRSLTEARSMPPRLGLRYLIETMGTPLSGRSRVEVFAWAGDRASPPAGADGATDPVFGLNEPSHFLRFCTDDPLALHPSVQRRAGHADTGGCGRDVPVTLPQHLEHLLPLIS